MNLEKWISFNFVVCILVKPIYDSGWWIDCFYESLVYSDEGGNGTWEFFFFLIFFTFLLQFLDYLEPRHPNCIGGVLMDDSSC